MQEKKTKARVNAEAVLETRTDKEQLLKTLEPDTNLYYQVLGFHELYNLSIRTVALPKLSDVSDEEIALRINLIAEEFKEYLDAFGVDYRLEFFDREEVDYNERGSSYVVKDSSPIVKPEYVKGFRDKIDVVEIADASADLRYVLMGADITFGIPGDLIGAEVQASNLTKLGDDGNPIYREDGKLLKGNSFVTPDIESILGGNFLP